MLGGREVLMGEGVGLLLLLLMLMCAHLRGYLQIRGERLHLLVFLFYWVRRRWRAHTAHLVRNATERTLVRFVF